MRKEELFELLGQVDPEYIADARPPVAGKSARRWAHWALPAACLALAVGTLLPGTWPVGPGDGSASSSLSAGSIVQPSGSEGSAASSTGSQGGASSPAGSVPNGGSSSVQSAPAGSQVDPSVDPGDLPLLNIPNEIPGAMGYEGLTLPEGEPLVLGSPWQEGQVIDRLPVYANGSFLDEAGTPWGMTEEEMEGILADTARALGVKVLETTRRRDGLTDSGEPMDAVTELVAVTDSGQIQVSANGNVCITFEGGLALPKGYSLSQTGSREQVTRALEWLAGHFAALLGYEQPGYSVRESYDMDGERAWDLVIYEAAGDAAQDVQEHSLRYARFRADEKGQLSSIWMYDWLDCAVKLGDYPVLALARAWSLLRGGNYVTSSPYALPGEDDVAGVELVYRASEVEQTLLPWYRFWVELPTGEADGYRTYGAYYVPAVELAYIAQLPLYQGHFN